MARKAKSPVVEILLPEPKAAMVPVNEDTFRPLVMNDLAGALGYGYQFDINGFPQNQGTPWSEQLSNSTSAFKNLRWYLVSNFRQLLNQLYVEIGLVQTITDVPVDDALRGGITVKTKQLDESDINQLQISIDRDNDLGVAGQAAKWNRLFGGAGILILTDQDPETPLELDSIGADDALEFRAVDMWELFWDKQNTEGFDPSTESEDFEFYSYYGVQVHKTRVMKLKGIEAPSFIRPRLRGWGFSVVEGLVRSLNQYFKGTDVLYEVLDEYKVDVFKINNLVNTLLSPGGEEKVRRRIGLAAWQKNYQNALTMDKEDDWDHKQLSFTGLGETLEQIRMQVASDMRMPLTKLFGISAAGFNSGEDDLEVYNAMVESQVRSKIKYQILRMVEIKCQKLFGFIPDDILIEFAPLRMMSAEQDQNVKTQKFNRLIQALQAGAIDVQFFHDACNRGGLFDLQMENVKGLMNPDGVDQPEVAGVDGDEKDEDIDDPGSDRANTQKAKATAKGGVPKGGKNRNAPLVILSLASMTAIPRYTALQRIGRILKNSAAFDRAAYEADGGDTWIDARRHELFKNPARVDKALWEKAKRASLDAYGEERWQFVVYIYKKLGGKF